MHVKNKLCNVLCQIKHEEMFHLFINSMYSNKLNKEAGEQKLLQLQQQKLHLPTVMNTIV